MSVSPERPPSADSTREPPVARDVRRARNRRTWWLLLGTIAALALAAWVAIAWIRIAVARHIRDELARASGRLGRPVQVDAIDVHVFPSIRIEIRGITVGSAAGSGRRADADGAHVERMTVRMSLRGLSGGGAAVDAIDVVGFHVHATRLASGAWSFDDVRRRVANRPAPREETHPPFSVGRLTIRDAGIDVVDDRGAGAVLAIRSLDISAEQVRADAPMRLSLRAALLGTATNLRGTVVFGPEDVHRNRVLRHLDGSLEGLAIDPLLRFFDVRAVRASAVRGQLAVDVARNRNVRVAVSFFADGIAVHIRNGIDSSPEDAALETSLAVDLASDNLDVDRLTLRVGPMSLEGSAHLGVRHDLPEVRALSLHSDGITLERLLALAPSIAPPGAVLQGPVDLHAEGSGTGGAAHVDLGLDLTRATLLLPFLDKPTGTPFSVDFHGGISNRSVTIEDANATLGPLTLAVRGEIRSPRDLHATFDTGEVALDPLFRLLPSVRASIPASVHLQGSVRASGEIDRANGADRASANVALLAARALTPAFSLAGAAGFHGSLRSEPHGFEVDAQLDATDARVVVPGRIDKPSGLPFRAALRAERTGNAIRVSLASLELPGASLRGTGEGDMAARHLSVRAPRCTFDVQQLARVAPLVVHRIPAALLEARAQFAARFEGDPHALGHARLALDDIDARAVFGRLQGRVVIDGLAHARRIEFAVTDGSIDLDALPVIGTVRPGVPHAAPPARADVDFAGLQASGTVHLSQLRVRDVRYAPIDASVALEAGRAVLRSIRVGMYGGSVVADGSEIALSAPHRFTLHVHADRLDLEQLHPSALDDPTRRPAGRFWLDADVTGSGNDDAAIRRSLVGQLRFVFQDVRLRHVSPGRTVVNPALSRSGRARPQDDAAPMVVQRFGAAFHVEHAILRTLEPVAMDSDAGTLRLTGDVGLDNSVTLSGVLVVAPAYLRTTTHGDYDPSGPIRVPLRVTGTLADPHFQLTDLAGTVAAFVGARVRGIGSGIGRIFHH